MRRLLRDVAAFLAIQAALFAALDLSFRRTHGRRHFLASFSDKRARLDRTAPPRILLVGGSGMAFGVNSTALERATGRPVVNLAMHAGLGLDFLLAQAADAARPGDLLLLSPEYRLLEAGGPFDAGTLQMQLLLEPSSGRFVGARHLPPLLDTGLFAATVRLRALESALRGDAPERLYNRAAFDARGDFVAHLGDGTRRGGSQHVRIPAADEVDDAGRSLAAFARRVRGAGGALVMVPPPVPADDYEPQRAQAAALWSRLSHDSGIEVRALRRTYGRELFFDTPYHLTFEGRRLRTRSLVQLVRRLRVP
jgi:hypothetical protein